jgi:hypothetical protein
MFKKKAIKDFEAWLSKRISCVSPLGELMVQKDGKWVNAFVEYLGGVYETKTVRTKVKEC